MLQTVSLRRKTSCLWAVSLSGSKKEHFEHLNHFFAPNDSLESSGSCSMLCASFFDSFWMNAKLLSCVVFDMPVLIREVRVNLELGPSYPLANRHNYSPNVFGFVIWLLNIVMIAKHSDKRHPSRPMNLHQRIRKPIGRMPVGRISISFFTSLKRVSVWNPLSDWIAFWLNLLTDHAAAFQIFT